MLFNMHSLRLCAYILFFASHNLICYLSNSNSNTPSFFIHFISSLLLFGIRSLHTFNYSFCPSSPPSLPPLYTSPLRPLLFALHLHFSTTYLSLFYPPVLFPFITLLPKLIPASSSFPSAHFHHQSFRLFWFDLSSLSHSIILLVVQINPEYQFQKRIRCRIQRFIGHHSPRAPPFMWLFSTSVSKWNISAIRLLQIITNTPCLHFKIKAPCQE